MSHPRWLRYCKGMCWHLYESYTIHHTSTWIVLRFFDFGSGPSPFQSPWFSPWTGQQGPKLEIESLSKAPSWTRSVLSTFGLWSYFGSAVKAIQGWVGAPASRRKRKESRQRERSTTWRWVRRWASNGAGTHPTPNLKRIRNKRPNH